MSKRLANQPSVRPRRRAARPPRVEGSRPNRFQTFLKRLRDGGRSNMYGAIPYLMHAFALDREAAFGIVCDWLDREQPQAREPPAGASSGR